MKINVSQRKYEAVLRAIAKRVKASVTSLKLGSKLFKIARAVIMITLAYQLLFPIIYMVSMALRPAEQAMDPSVIWIPKSITFDNFMDTLKVMNYKDALKNSFFIGILCGFLDVASCALAGYGFARFKFPGEKLLFGLVIFTLIVPTQTLLLPIYADMRYFDGFGLFPLLSKVTGVPDSINLIGSYLTFILPSLLGMGLRSGLYIFIFRQFFKNMPVALEDAAYIDGCGPLKTFLRIIMPNAKNSIITVFLFSFVWHWNEYYLSNLLLGASKSNCAVALSTLRIDLQSVVNVQTISDPLTIATRIQAGSLLVIFPLVLLYLFTQNYFTDSIEHVGIK